MYAINRAVQNRPNEQPEVEHIFTEDSTVVYQLFLGTQEEFRGKEIQRTKIVPKARRKTRARI